MSGGSGKILQFGGPDGTLMSLVDFGGVQKDVCLQYIPDAAVGEYVVVHVGFAIQRLDEESAIRTLADFEHLGVLDEEFGDGFEIAAKQAGVPSPGNTATTRGDAMKYLDEFSNPELAGKLLDQIQRGHHPALGDHGGLRRADALDHPARHRPAAARRDRDDPRPGLSGVRDPAGDDRQGARDRVPARRDLLLVRRHAARAGQREGPVPDQERGRRHPGGLLAAGRADHRQGEPGPAGGVLRDRLRDHRASQRHDRVSGQTAWR